MPALAMLAPAPMSVARRIGMTGMWVYLAIAIGAVVFRIVEVVRHDHVLETDGERQPLFLPHPLQRAHRGLRLLEKPFPAANLCVRLSHPVQ